MAAAPLICVCLKPALRTDVRLRLGAAGAPPPGGEALRAAGAAELAALRLALALRDAVPAAAGAALRPHVLALCVAPHPPADGETVLREALASGADAALRVWGRQWAPEAAPLDGCGDATRAHAQAAAEVLRPRAPRLVLTGERSGDTGHEQFGATLAAQLGAAFAHRVSAAEPAGDGWRVTVRLERGYGQVLHVDAPAVLTVAAGGARPADASLPRWLAARAATIPVAAPELPPPRPSATLHRVPLPRVKPYRVPARGLSAEQRIEAMVAMEAQGAGTVLADATAEQQAEAVLRLLRERALL